MSSSRHLDLSEGREVVFCHNCENEWYKDSDDLQCPRCHSEICEIIEPDNDPRSEFEPPPPLPFHSRPFGGHNDDFPDPDEDNIDDFMSHMHRPRDSPNRGSGSPGQHPVDPGSQDEIFLRFQETLNMLMGSMGGPLGATGRSDRQTLFGSRGPTGSTQTRIVHLPGGTTTFSITTGNIPMRSPGDRGMGHDDDFDMIFGNTMGGGNIRSPNGGDPTLDNPLQNIFSLLFGPGGPNAVHGDAVYSQEALDRIITQLMEANPSSNAAPPASEAAIEKLQKKKLDKEMMGDGKAECTICIDDMNVGDEVTVLPCNHWFHGECVVLWLKEHNTCPICRTPIEKRDANENRSNGGNGEAGGSSGHHQRRASEGGSMPPSSGWLGGASPGWASGTSRSGGFGGSSRSRGPQTPEDRERRLNTIRNLAGAGSYGQSPPEPPRWNTFRRDSWSPTSPPPGGSSARERSPTRPRPGRSNSSSWNSQRSSRSSNNSGGNGGSSSNPLSWIRDRFSGGSGNNQNNNSSRRRQ